MLEPRVRDEVYWDAQDGLEFVLNPQDGEQARAGREVDQDVQVTALVVVASGNAAEDAGVPDSVTLKHLAHGRAPIVAGSDLPVRTPLAPVG